MTDLTQRNAAVAVPAATEVATQLAQARDRLHFMQQFFDAIGEEQKSRLWRDDQRRLLHSRNATGYAAAFRGDPLLSIIVPILDRVDMLFERTIPSVLAQTYPHWELIIVADGLDEGEASRLARAIGPDPRMYFRNLKSPSRLPPGIGPGQYSAGLKPMNFGLRVARGAWLSHLDNGDAWLPGHLQDLLRLAQQGGYEWTHGLVQCEQQDDAASTTLGGVTPVIDGISRTGSLYHAGLKGFRYNLESWRYFCPGDWDRCDRWLQMGVRHAHLPEVTAIHCGNFGELDRLGHVRSRSGLTQVSYPRWASEFVLAEPLRQKALAGMELAQVTVLVLAHAATLGQLELTLSSLAAQSYAAVQIDVTGFAQAGLDAAAYQDQGLGLCCHTGELEAGWAAAGTWLLVLRAGDRLSPDALLVLAERVGKQSETSFWYLDEDRLDAGRVSDPIFKPDFNPDLLRSYPYIGSTALVDSRLCQDWPSNIFVDNPCWTVELAYRQLEKAGITAVGHIAECLYHSRQGLAAWLGQPQVIEAHRQATLAHFQRRGIQAKIAAGLLPLIQRIQYQHESQPLVSIIIPSKDQFILIAGLVESIAGKTLYQNYELIIVDNGSTQPEACHYLDGLLRLNNPRIRVLRYPHRFNYSAINNFAVGEARGEYLVLLNNDTVVIDGAWLDELLNHAQRPEVGIVGAKLYYPDGRIQHGGVVLGLGGPAEHPFIGSAMDAAGYMNRLQVDQNYSAVTGACLMIRRSVFAEVGGLDEAELAVSYNDIDLCLKVGRAGHLVVWTPYAKVVHHGSVSQRQLDTAAEKIKQDRFKAEQDVMYRRWLPLLAHDPAYNRNFSLKGTGYELDAYRHIAWQPFSSPILPRVVCHAADKTGCGHYRIRQPFQAMQQEGVLDGTITDMLLDPVLLERFQTDAVILQRQHTPAQRAAIKRYRAFSEAFLVYELDDYMLNLPMKSLHRQHMPSGLHKQLREAVAMTDRFVVSTECLAEHLGHMHSDMRVVRNRLPLNWWSGLRSERRVSAKPRVGWGGGVSHTGDLEMIAEVVRELADEVDWIFFGMCPEKLRPYVKEFYLGVPIETYPAKLASLNLDLALAPLEDNLFNACKSNLRLLEYGACGFPVVCSDLVTYQDNLPVTRVKNRFKDWVTAIRMHLSDLDATAVAGDHLREVVHRDWMLTGQNLIEWRDAWLPS